MIAIWRLPREQTTGGARNAEFEAYGLIGRCPGVRLPHHFTRSQVRSRLPIGNLMSQTIEASASASPSTLTPTNSWPKILHFVALLAEGGNETPGSNKFKEEEMTMSTRLVLATLLAAFAVGTGNLRAGASPSPIDLRTDVLAGSTDRYNPVVFRADQTAWVVVGGDGDTILDLFVYDENGNLVDSDACQHDRCVATWTPKWTGNFYIQVHNRGDVYNEYTMLSN